MWELLSFLIEITADTFGVKDDKGKGYWIGKVLAKTGMKGTGVDVCMALQIFVFTVQMFEISQPCWETEGAFEYGNYQREADDSEAN
ncbi:3-hydroxyacyl-CoA dehydrogenase [Trema orientale]|nr:3-hydroxyacyl-CoA dehydrogenase [Trema orientale]